MSSTPSNPEFEPLRIHAFAALEAGPRLIVIGGVHGNETCGSVGIDRAIAELDAGTLALRRGQLTLVPVANPLARRLQRREGDRNLNRSFQPTAPGKAPPDHEARATDVLCPLLDRHDVLLDLHSFESQGDAFAMIGPRDNEGALEPFSRAFEEGQLALALGTTRVVEGWLDIYAASLVRRANGRPVDEAALVFGWGTNEYMRSRGGYGVTLECGQHRDPAAPEVAYRAVVAALRFLEMLAPAADDQGPQEPRAPALLRLVSVTDRDDAADRFAKAWATFDPVDAGTLIGTRADGRPEFADRDGFIVFANASAEPGTEWFYFAVESDRDLGALPDLRRPGAQR